MRHQKLSHLQIDQIGYCTFLSDELAYRRLYLILTIPLDRYDAFVKKIEISSPAYEVLRKAVFERQTKSDHFERIMNVICNGREAEMLLDLANHVYPDIAPDIARHITRANESVLRSDKG